MKKFIQWLAKVFNANITVVKEVVRTEVKTETCYLPPEGGVIEGDVNVYGDLHVRGSITVTGGMSCTKVKED